MQNTHRYVGTTFSRSEWLPVKWQYLESESRVERSQRPEISPSHSLTIYLVLGAALFPLSPGCSFRMWLPLD